MFDKMPLVKNIGQLLPSSEITKQTTFIVSGPRLIDALMEGREIDDAAREAGLTTEDAIQLMATDEFRRYVEAYVSIGDLATKPVRIRIAKSILAIQIANGVVAKKREPLDILEYVRKEQISNKGIGNGVHVHLHAGNIPRPYTRVEEMKTLVGGNNGEEKQEEKQEQKEEGSQESSSDVLEIKNG